MAKLSAKERNALPAKDFAGPDRSFPVNDKNHARNALARASQFHPELKAKIRKEVHRKFPDIKLD
jgi:ribosomal protein S25